MRSATRLASSADILPCHREGVLKQFDFGTVGGQLDRHDVEPARTIVYVMADHIVERHGGKTTAFEGGDRLRRQPIAAAVPGLDLDEHQGRAIERNDVDFSTSPAVAPRND